MNVWVCRHTSAETQPNIPEMHSGGHEWKHPCRRAETNMEANQHMHTRRGSLMPHVLGQDCSLGKGT